MEETPKKCKDIIKTARSLLNDVQFAQFGDDPKVRLAQKCSAGSGLVTADMSHSYHNSLSFILLFFFFFCIIGGGDGPGKNSASDY